MKTNMMIIAALLMVTGSASAQQPAALTVGMYAPSAAFADAQARLGYVQGLAKAIQTKTGIPTTGKAYIRLDDLMKAKPDFAIIEGQCVATKSPGTVLATANINGDTAQAWALYTRGEGTFNALKGKKLVFVQTGCRDSDFLDNAMLDSEVKTKSHFASLVDKPDVTGAVAAVREFKAGDALFVPTSAAKGLTKLFDTGSVPNPAFVQLNKSVGGVTDKVKDAVLGYGAQGGIDGWKAGTNYGSLSGRMGARVKKAVFAPPEPVRVEDLDILVTPASNWQMASIDQHFWDPAAQ